MFLAASDLVTPFITGFVGYFTNFLAIKMLFRPHKRKIYSFGWQGVIPKNRKRLAKEVSTLVGENLLAEKDIVSALNKEDFQIYLRTSVQRELKDFLSKDFGTVNDIFTKTGLDIDNLISSSYEKIIINDKLQSSILKIFIEKIEQTRIFDFIDLEKSVDTLLKNILKEGKWQEKLVKEISAYLNNLILSGVSPKDILPENLYNSFVEKSEDITISILKYIKKVSEDKEVKEKIVQKLIELKNSSFNSGFFDKLKLGVLNMFLNEDVIRDIVQSKFPEIMDNILESEEIKRKITDSIKEKVTNILNTPIYKYIERFNVEDFYSFKSSIEIKILNFLKSDFLSEKIKYLVISNKEYLKSLKTRELLNFIGIDLSNNIDNKIFRNILKDSYVKETVVDKISSIIKDIKVENIYDKISQKTFRKVVDFTTLEINALVQRNIKPVLKAIDIKSIVEKKIDFLNLYEIEDMLFSFMKEQFKWINILGFILGFIFGSIQILFFKLNIF